MILYLDTSALVKLYVDEEFSDRVRHWITHAEVVAACRVAFLEARAAFARRRREGAVDRESIEKVTGQLEVDSQRFFVVELSRELVSLAIELVDRHPLRSLDALHLAAALFIRQESGELVTFCGFDDRLNQAAKAEGLGLSEL